MPKVDHQAAPRLSRPHHEDSRFRYCTNFIVSGSGLDSREHLSRLEGLGDSVLVVGDEATLKVHVHTDEPEAAVGLFEGRRRGHQPRRRRHARAGRRTARAPAGRQDRRSPSPPAKGSSGCSPSSAPTSCPAARRSTPRPTSCSPASMRSPPRRSLSCPAPPT